MNIFEKRPLCLTICIGLGGFFFFTFDNLIIRIILIALAILPIIFSFISTFEHSTLRIMRISGVVLLLSFLLSYLYFDKYFNLYDRYEERVEVVGLVEEISPSSTSYSQRLRIKIRSIDGKRVIGYRVYAYPNKTDAKGIVENTKISFTTEFGGFSDDSKQYNISNGINSYANEVEDIRIIEYTKGNLTGRFSRFREYISRYIILISDKDTGALLSALLLGERDYLPDQLRLDFKRIGISHILALSGMHLAILSVGIGFLLKFLRVKKKKRLIITSSIVLMYMALTGFSVSVCRAGIMLIISSLLFLLGWQKDSFTSLSVSVAVICLFTPYAIYDISLWLSAAATLGIIALAEYYPNNKEIKSYGKTKRYLYLSVTASLFATSSTILISVFTFGGYSILSILTTLIFSVLAEIIMYLGCIMILIGWLIPIKYLIWPFTKLLYLLSGWMSSFKFAFVSSNFLIVKIAVILYSILFFIFLLFGIKNKARWMKIISVAFSIVMILPVVGTISSNFRETVAYSSEYRSDFMLIRSKNEVCLINSSQYSKTTAYDALDLAEDANVTTIDKYYLTHYSWSLDEDIETLLYNISVKQILIPSPRNDDEETILKILYNSVENSRTEIHTYDIGDIVQIGKYNILLLYSAPYGTTSMNAFTVYNDESVYTYISSGLYQDQPGEDLKHIVADSDHLIFGEHGKKYKTTIYFSQSYDQLESIVFHSDNIYLTQKCMQFYLDQGCEIYSHPKEVIYFK